MGAHVCPVCGLAVDDGAAACPSCGFKLLGTTQEFKPLNISDDGLSVAEKPFPEAALTVVRGPQSGLVFKLGADAITVGRSPRCDVFLNDMTVSRQHALIVPADGGHVITDDHSFNGVWVNNESVESRLLSSGDLVQIGAFCLCYQEQ